jgi:TolB protein
MAIRWIGRVLVVVGMALALAGCAAPPAVPSDASDDQQRIALTLFRNEKADVYLIHADGTGLVNLTNDPMGAGAGGPSWSPDGQRIAFSSSRGGNSDIYTIHPDGSNLVQLTASEQDEVAPLWSPDGQHILFYAGSRSDYTQAPSLFIMDADGTDATHLTNGSYPVWSPDSRRILYENPARRDGIIHIINADGTDNRDLVNGFAPSWSPDGTRIAFQHRNQIHTVDPNGSDIELLADGISPDWSPDGTTIAFVGLSPEGRTISVMDPDGTNKRALTERGDHLHPRWSPDGHYIAFTRGTTFGIGGGGLLVMDADGTNEISLVGIGRVPQFTWEP